MAVMVTLTLKTDPATYQSLHEQMLELARPAGLLFHSSYEVGGQVGIVDYWPSEDAWNAFARGPLAQGMKLAKIDKENNLLLINGSVPGPNGGYVVVQETNKVG